MAQLEPNCIWCGSPLKGHSFTEFKGATTFVGSCPSCGDYTMAADLVADADSLSDGKRAAVHKFLSDLWDLTAEVNNLTHHFVFNQLGDK